MSANPLSLHILEASRESQRLSASSPSYIHFVLGLLMPTIENE
jgi:hypothetical protein